MYTVIIIVISNPALLCSLIDFYSVRLIASVPGAHTGSRMFKWGHMKLRKVING